MQFKIKEEITTKIKTRRILGTKERKVTANADNKISTKIREAKGSKRLESKIQEKKREEKKGGLL